MSIVWMIWMFAGGQAPSKLERLPYRRPGLAVDLGVGLYAFPIPVDFDRDGDLDLVVSCPDKPYNGTYFFENPSGPKATFPVFRKAKRIGRGVLYGQMSEVAGVPRFLTPGKEHPNFFRTGFDDSVLLPLPANVHERRVRGNFWRYVDFDGDGKTDVLVGADDWTDYGWDDGYSDKGEWKRGPLRGFVYLARNSGTDSAPRYDRAVKLTRENDPGKPIETFGWPAPNLADFDGDGDLDLLCGDFLDRFTYFENRGSRTQPSFADGRPLPLDGKPLVMELQMMNPVAVDWDRDGDIDLVVGDEDGRVAWIEHSGRNSAGAPQFRSARFFQQEADELKLGALATPVGFDWDGDGDTDIVGGATAGFIEWFENLSGPGVGSPVWAPPRRLEVDGSVFRVTAGPNGSIQGPCEANWGYTTLSIADWDRDGLPDIVFNSIWGKVQWLKNRGSRKEPRLTGPFAVEVDWPLAPAKPAWTWWTPAERSLVTQWRTTPFAIDWNRDGWPDLVMLDTEGYLAYFERNPATGRLKPGQRTLVDEQGKPLRLNAGQRGKSGRRKFCLADWDGDGRLDLLLNGENATFYRRVGPAGEKAVFRNEGRVSDRVIEGHDTSPTTVDWNGDGAVDLLIGAEDGHLYYLANPHGKRDGKSP